MSPFLAYQYLGHISCLDLNSLSRAFWW
ncbi:unnamed protein product [Callosobruchus maculatus]|uniref:Uncharacterized protein n=1 Tax=Callosobruchus maculatus TaxID=64391 RepID=A0A653BUK0_CALMS|nr:unnamed protein product [Callosobruchus maculatus]